MQKHYVLIDLENVIPDSIDLLNQEWISVLLFVGENQTKIPITLAKTIQCLGERARYLEISGTGHNALDFHIAYYIGCLSAADKTACFHIISNDTGFDPLIRHLRQIGISASRSQSVETISELKFQSSMKSADERLALAKERLLIPNQPRPRKRKTLASHIAAMFKNTLPEEEIAHMVDELFSRNIIRENGTRLVYSDETPNP